MEVGFRVKDGVGVRHVNVGVIGFWWTSEGVSASAEREVELYCHV